MLHSQTGVWDEAKQERKNWDFVGNQDRDVGFGEVQVVDGIEGKEDCAEECEKWKECLAWSFERQKASVQGRCVLSDWVVAGNTTEGRWSGVPEGRMVRLRDRCKWKG